MDRVFDFVVDATFYGFIEGVIYYLSIRFINREFNNKFVDIIKNGFIIGVGLSVCSGFVQMFGLTQFLMGLWIGIYYCIFCKRFNMLYIFQGVFIIVFIYFLEISILDIYLKFTNIQILSLELNNLQRLTLFIISKLIEILILYIMRCIIMKTNKTVIGGTKPRGHK